MTTIHDSETENFCSAVARTLFSISLIVWLELPEWLRHVHFRGGKTTREEEED